jgi:hypothetical protein
MLVLDSLIITPIGLATLFSKAHITVLASQQIAGDFMVSMELRDGRAMTVPLGVTWTGSSAIHSEQW